MKLVLLQLGRLLLALLVLYAGALVLSLLLAPSAHIGQRLNTARAAESLFLTEPKYVFMARSRLNSTTDKLLLLGASNVQAGFKQEQLQALLPDQEVHNLAVGGSNMTQIEQIVELVREVQSKPAQRHDCYVIGLWYGLFADDRARWYTADRSPGDTDIDIERYRYGFYRRAASGPVPLLAPRYLDAEVMLIRPYLLLDRLARDATESLRGVLLHKPVRLSDEERNALLLSDAQKQSYLQFWQRYMGSIAALSEAPFATLNRTVDTIVADGGQVVLVDLPIPEWHAQGSRIYADYRKRIDPLLLRLQARSGVTVLKMSDANREADFSDEVHPKPRVAPQWAERLARALDASGAARRAQAANDFSGANP